MAYHHGDLPAAMMRAGLDVTRTGGVAALTIREVTRRAGVTPNAAYRHFPDRRSLVMAVSAAIGKQMAEGMAAPLTDETSPTERLRAVGLGYIRFALTEPGWFSTAFFGIGAPATDAVEQAPPYLALTAALDAMVDAGELTPAARVDAPWACWAAVHGFAELALNGPLRSADEETVERYARFTVDTAIAGIRGA
ncbi:TetR/AcrR family transcriptional regulator [Tsukamurella soli]|uniref:TetR/AcrR family transcriptional regulator n=1 Tax=Tsukamurella soli TaxID=644556 RepID=A0ABP8J0Z1_9ACTN